MFLRYRVLRDKQSTDSNVGRRSSHTPANVASSGGTIVEGGEDEFGRLMGRSLCKHSNGEAADPNRVEDDRGGVEVTKEGDAEGVDGPV